MSHGNGNETGFCLILYTKSNSWLTKSISVQSKTLNFQRLIDGRKKISQPCCQEGFHKQGTKSSNHIGKD